MQRVGLMSRRAVFGPGDGLSGVPTYFPVANQVADIGFSARTALAPPPRFILWPNAIRRFIGGMAGFQITTLNQFAQSIFKEFKPLCIT